MRKETIDRVVSDDGDDDGDKIEVSLSDEEVIKMEAGLRIQSELAGLGHYFRPRKPYQSDGDEGKYPGQRKGEDSGSGR